MKIQDVISKTFTFNQKFTIKVESKEEKKAKQKREDQRKKDRKKKDKDG